MGQADRRDHARIERITKALFKADLDAVTGIGAELLTPFLSNMEELIIGHWRITSGERIPDFRRIVVLSLTEASLGNGIEIGLADFTTRRFVDAYDPAISYVNILTASEPGGNTCEGPMPLALASDREAIEVALFSSLAGDAPRLCRIKNTAALGEFWVSEAMMDEVKENPKLRVIEPIAPMAFDESGNLF